MLYRRNLQRLAPDLCKQIDDVAVEAGEAWVVDVTTGERSCTVAQAAAILELTPRRVQQLARDGTLRHGGRTRAGYTLLLDDVERLLAARRCAS